ncbi:uncharacterized protein LOC134193276 isoform X2 [Corticium candelabrum]|uniref:uncharacterized protein LOC134193276 isoform X2 n=1 Tax=Corticium candelabrum TaxID=121492 RepID=UPI002E258EE1|nr:uncharacterized protein LOC134193276 isoform X2 [Corticium candelabrum]
MDRVVFWILSAVIPPVLGLYHLYSCSDSRRRYLALCPIFLVSTAAVCNNLYHFTFNHEDYNQEWPAKFASAHNACLGVILTWAMTVRWSLPCHALRKCRLYGQRFLAIVLSLCVVGAKAAGLLSWGWPITMQMTAVMVLVLWDVLDSLNVSVKVHCICMDVLYIVSAVMIMTIEMVVSDFDGKLCALRVFFLLMYAMYYINVLTKAISKKIDLLPK